MDIHRTKIIASLGLATGSPEALRINFSHGTHEERDERASQVRPVASEAEKEMAILADLRGPVLNRVCSTILKVNSMDKYLSNMRVRTLYLNEKAPRIAEEKAYE